MLHNKNKLIGVNEDMKKEKFELLGSAGSKEDLEKLINKFYYSTNWIITEDNRVYNKLKEKFNDNVRVIIKKNRWRFELSMED